MRCGAAPAAIFGRIAVIPQAGMQKASRLKTAFSEGSDGAREVAGMNMAEDDSGIQPMNARSTFPLLSLVCRTLAAPIRGTKENSRPAALSR